MNKNEEFENDDGGFKKSTKKGIKKGLKIGKLLFKGAKLKLLLIKILIAIKFLLIFLLILIVIILIVVVISFFIWVIMELKEDPTALVSMGIGIIGTVIISPIGELIGFDLKPLAPLNVNSVPVYNYIIDDKDKNNVLNLLKNDLNIESESIQSNSGIKDMFNEYNQGYGNKILSFFGGNDLNENFEDAKVVIDKLYSLKYDKKESDLLIFNLIGGKKYSENFNNLGGNIINKIYKFNLDSPLFKGFENQGIRSMGDINNWIYKEGYSGIVINNTTGSGNINSKFYQTSNLENFNYTGSGNYYTFDINIEGNLNINNSNMLEYFYFKKSISDYLETYGNNISDLSNNDLKYLTKYNEGDKGLVNDDIGDSRINELREVLNFKEDKFLYNLLLNNPQFMTIVNNSRNLKSDELIYSKKQIIKIYIDRYYNIYKELNNNTIVLSLGYYDLPGEVGNEAVCKMTQLYGKSNVSSKYVNGIHNGYDMVFSTRNMLSMTDGKVIKEGKNKSLGNYILIESNSIDEYNGKNVKFTFEYLHLSSTFVKEGDKVFLGQRIGIQGNTGNSIGEHLHLSIYPHDINSLKYDNSTSGYLNAITVNNFVNSVGLENIFKSNCASNNISNNIGNVW